MKKILVTGSNGQLGKALQRISSQYPMSFTFLDRLSLDITDPDAITKVMDTVQPDFLINCAAYTAVDLAETEPASASAINVQAVAALAEATAKQNCTLIHISSDYVYHNSVNRPLLETDVTEPKGVYASTKLAGENEALSKNNKSIVIRTSWVYGTTGNNFLKSMLRLGEDRDELSIVFDQIGAPTFVIDLAKSILAIVNSDLTDKYGIYNYSNEGIASWYDFALAIFECANINCKVTPILSKDYPTPASRPTYSVMDKSKIKQTFNIEIPHWRDSLVECLQIMDT